MTEVTVAKKMATVLVEGNALLLEGVAVECANSLEFGASPSSGAWAVGADSKGGLNFVVKGKLVFRHQLFQVEAGV